MHWLNHDSGYVRTRRFSVSNEPGCVFSTVGEKKTGHPEENHLDMGRTCKCLGILR